MLTREQIAKILEQKRKLFLKTQTPSAEYTNLQRTFDTRDLFEEYAWSQEYDMNLIAMTSAFTLGITFDEILPISFLKEPETPSPEEIEAGINLPVETPAPEDILQEIIEDIEAGKIELPAGVSKEDIINALKNPVSANAGSFTPEEADEITRETPEKAYYEVSHYDMSYYDPEYMIEFLRALLYRLYNDTGDPQTLAKDILKLGDQFGIQRDLVVTIFNRIQLLRATKYQMFILGVSQIGASLWNNENKVLFMDMDGNIKEVEINNLDDALLGFALDNTALGYGFTTYPDTVIRPLNKVYENNGKKTVPALPVLLEYLYRKVDKTVNNYFLTPIAFTNYSTVPEMTDLSKSEKMDVYATLQNYRYAVENLIESICNKHSVNQYQKRQYQMAGLQYVTRNVESHSWGKDLLLQMSDDEFTDFWLDHWERQGLNREILLEIKGEIEKWFPNLREKSREQAEQMRLRRKMKAYLSKLSK
jgi:hypothetical protein